MRARRARTGLTIFHLPRHLNAQIVLHVPDAGDIVGKIFGSPLVLATVDGAVDAGFAAVGSFNLGLDSFRMNLEGAVATASPDFIYALTDQLELNFSVSKRM